MNCVCVWRGLYHRRRWCKQMGERHAVVSSLLDLEGCGDDGDVMMRVARTG